MIIRPAAAEVFRDYVTDGDPTSGPYSPLKSDIRNLFTSRGQFPSDFGAVGDTADARDLVMTLDSNVVSSPSGMLGSATVGQTIVIYGAGDGGIPLISTVQNASNAPNSIVLADDATTAVTNAFGFFGTDDTAALTAWAAAPGMLCNDPTAIYLISAPVVFPAVIVGKLRLRMTSDVAAGSFGFTTGGANVGTAQTLTGVSAGATSFTPPDATKFRVGDFFHAASNQPLGLQSSRPIGEIGIVQSINSDGSITPSEPFRFSYGNFRVASLGFVGGVTRPGAGFAIGDFLTLLGGTLISQPVTLVTTATNMITVGIGAPIWNMIDHFTGASLQMLSTGALPTGISAATNYYAGNVTLAEGSFTCHLYTSQADALAGGGASLVNITSTGSGTISAQMPFQMRVSDVSQTGAIKAWVPITWGSYSAVPAVPATFSTTGSGTGVQAQSVVLEACTVTPVVPITPDLDIEIIGDGYTDHGGISVLYARGGLVKASGAYCGDRVLGVTGCLDTRFDLGNVHNIDGQTTSLAVSVNGPCRRVVVSGTGEQHLTYRGSNDGAGNPPNIGVPLDTVFENFHIAGTSAFPVVQVAVNAVDSTSGANTITIATTVSNGDQVLVAVSSGGALPGGLIANTPVFVGNVSSDGAGNSTFQPYQDYDDAVNGLSINAYILTSAGTGTLMATAQTAGDAFYFGNAQLGTTLRHCIVESSRNNGVNFTGGGGRILDTIIRNAATNGVYLSNGGFYPVSWELDGVISENSGRYGILVEGGGSLKDRLLIGRVVTRNSSVPGFRAIAGSSGSILVEQSGVIRSDYDQSNQPASSACVIFAGVIFGAIPEVCITGVPAGAIGLRLFNCTGGKAKGGMIVAGGAGCTLIQIDTNSSHLLIDRYDLNDAGLATVTGIKVSDTTITNIKIGSDNDFHACATPVLSGASSAANGVAVAAGQTIYANHAGSPYTAPNGSVKYFTDSTSGAITINPPTHVCASDNITIKDDAGTAQTHNVTFGGTVGSNDNTVLAKQGDFARYDYSINQSRWSQTQ